MNKRGRREESRREIEEVRDKGKNEEKRTREKKEAQEK